MSAVASTALHAGDLPHLHVVLLLMLAALLAGFLDAVVGGGGLVQLPMLLLLLPAALPIQILATNKVASVCGTSVSAATFVRRIKPEARTVGPLAGLALVGSVAGALTAGLVPKDVFRQVVLLALVIVATFVWLRPALGKEAVPRFHGHRHLLAAGVSGLTIGWYDGAVGPGTGTFLVFVLVGFIGLDFLRASATAKIANVATNLGALAVFVPQGAPLWRLGLLMGLANLVGGFVGARTALARGVAFIRVVFLLVSTALMIRLGVQISAAH